MNQRFSVAGIIIVAVLLWVYGINGTKEIQKTINSFLFVLLASIIILRWDKISPLIFKNGTTNVTKPVVPDKIQTGGTRA
ncbi:hypothetical protein D3C73_736480 [compost metagenome]